MFWAGVFAAVKKIPWQVWVLSGGMALFAMSNLWSFQKGQASTQADWDASVERGKVLVEKLKEGQGTITERVETVYVDRWKTIYEQGETIEREIPVYIPTAECYFSGGFRLLHDGAISGSLPGPAAIPDAAPVSAREVAGTVTRNYIECKKAISDLEGLRTWVLEQERLHHELCKQQGVRCSKDSS